MSGLRIPVSIRERKEEDKAFIFSTWLKSFRKGSEFARYMTRQDFFTYHHPVLEACWARNSTRVLVAHDPESEDSIFGYLVFECVLRIERPIVHYVYVREAFQNLGVATALVAASKIDPSRCYLTHLTRDKYDQNERSPRYGELRWRGAETLLKRWPLYREEYDTDRNGKRHLVQIHEGNRYVPHLM